MIINLFEGVFFVESNYPNVEIIEPIEVKIGGILSNSQLRSLNDVKARMVERARQLNGNIITNFIYGQKSPSFLGSFFNMDDVNWFGKGIIARLSDGDYKDLITKTQKPSE